MTPRALEAAASKRASIATLAGLLAACGTSVPSRTRARELTELPAGTRTALEHAELFVPARFQLAASGEVPLFVHFQGGVPIAIRNFHALGTDGVLIASTLSGLSSTFRKPYEDPARFRALLAAGEDALAARHGRKVRFAPITLTFFSAGYGAVREILKHDDLVDRVTTLISADSIYADVVSAEVRAPRVDQMLPFARFAQAAARGEKTFVLACSAIRTPYASTRETALALLANVGARFEPCPMDALGAGLAPRGRAHVGGFTAWEFAEDAPSIHVDLLWAIPQLWRHRASEGDASAGPESSLPRLEGPASRRSAVP